MCYAMNTTYLNCHLWEKIIKSVPLLGITQETFTLYATNEGFISIYRHFTSALVLSTILQILIAIITNDLFCKLEAHVSLAITFVIWYVENL